MTRHITNTTREVNEEPLRALVMGLAGGIEASEARGQRELVNSDRLPTDTRDEAAFLALGFTFGEPDERDPMFRPATLPKGWKREASDHAMWSHLIDERGIRRASIFYKAAFYDRSAHMSLDNVGYAIGSSALGSDTPPTRESLKLDLLTAEEREQVKEAADRRRDDIARYPDIYGKYAERLAQLDAILADAR